MHDTKILIVDDHPFIMEGLMAIISKLDNYRIVGEAKNGEEAIEKSTKLKPDVLIMDISMPTLDGITAARRITDGSPETRIVMLSMHEDPIFAINSFRSGASAYILKESASEELLAALEKVMAGKYYISPTMVDELLSNLVDLMKKDTTFDATDSLTTREREILTLIVRGLSNSNIAEELFISVSTVKTHKSNILKKLGVKDAAALVKLAISKGIA